MTSDPQLSASFKAYAIAAKATLDAAQHLIDQGDLPKAVILMQRLNRDHGIVVGVMEANVRVD